MTHPIDLLSRSTTGLSTPMAVQIVRPKKSWSDLLCYLAEDVVGMFVYAWPLMWLIPQFTDWHPGYWQCAAGYLAARIVLSPSTSDYQLWTREP
jgi:hypothetical protein